MQLYLTVKRNQPYKIPSMIPTCVIVEKMKLNSITFCILPFIWITGKNGLLSNEKFLYLYYDGHITVSVYQNSFNGRLKRMSITQGNLQLNKTNKKSAYTKGL